MRQAQRAVAANVAALDALNQAIRTIADQAFLPDDEAFTAALAATIKARKTFLRTARELNLALPTQRAANSAS